MMDYEEMFERSSGFNDIHDMEEEIENAKWGLDVCRICKQPNQVCECGEPMAELS